MAEMGERGRKAQKQRRTPLAEHEIPDLKTPQDAARYLEMISKWTGTGRITHAQGRTMTGAVQQWLKAHEVGDMTDQLTKLKVELERQRER